jgi:GT2 family glycosyltransferase
LSVLDWGSGLQLAERFPEDAVFAPRTDGDSLPYLDGSIDFVALAGSSGERLAEARRVARLGVLRHPARRKGDDELVIERLAGPRPALPSASIIIPTFNGIRHLDACLRALTETLPEPFDGEVIVVDDASSGSTRAALLRWVRKVSWLRVLRNAHNLGFLSSCNRGARAARGDVLVFLNDDTVPQPRWLEALLHTLEQHGDAGAVGGRLVYPDGRLQEAGGVIFRDGSGANIGRDDFDVDSPLYGYVRRVSYCSGALLATPAALFHELGGFDRRYRPAYYEDTDYCFAVRESGRSVYYQPDSVVIHLEGATSGTDTARGIKRHQLVNRERFRRKWRHRLETAPEPPARYTRSTWHELASAWEAA